MIKDITIGQYFPFDSFVHRLDPRTKLLFTVVYIVAAFVSNNFVSLLFCFIIACVVVAISKIPLKTVIKGLRPILLIVIITSLLQIAYIKTGVPLISFWKINITSGGLLSALFMALRISLLIIMSTMLTYTTSPTSLTNGLERIFAPFKKIGIDFHTITMIMTIALRFIPTLIEETDKIMSAQKSRGANFENGNIVKRAKALVPIFIPLLFNSIRRAYELANAMTCRCYNGGKGKTTMNPLKMSGRDYFAVILTLAVIGGIIVLNIFCGEYNAEFTFNAAV
ncbi:MAG: energy-coupling factor transporter transmembrane protein EcfT [Oscillospiraceae bacterium]|nr:energy-coupling factor transporter transmembrane protein EcfT [Oscillospiraceae bacterium]